MKVVVTGGGGFIGSHLVERLLRSGHQVRVFDSFATGRRENLAGLEDAELLVGDLRDRTSVRAAMKGAEAVFHLAALPSVARSWQDPVTTLAVNALGTVTVAEEAVRAGAGALVYSSSSSVYGEQEAERKSEDLEPRPLSPYGYSKLLGEKVALAHSRAGDIRVVALRYFNVFGPRQDPGSPYSGVLSKFITAMRDGGEPSVFGDGEQSRDFTFVQNVVAANLQALETPGIGGRAFNLGTGGRYTLNYTLKLLEQFAGRSAKAKYGPPREGDIRDSQADVRRAAQAFGYKPQVNFEEGLRRTWDWYSAQP
jgi:nucleoside-diphosphate-sugar epimerase